MSEFYKLIADGQTRYFRGADAKRQAEYAYNRACESCKSGELLEEIDGKWKLAMAFQHNP